MGAGEQVTPYGPALPPPDKSLCASSTRDVHRNSRCAHQWRLALDYGIRTVVRVDGELESGDREIWRARTDLWHPYHFFPRHVDRRPRWDWDCHLSHRDLPSASAPADRNCD